MGLEESHFPLAKPRAFSVLSSPLDSMQWSKSQLTQNKDELFSLDNCEVSCSVAPDSLQPCGLQPTRLLCPWDSPGKSTGVGCRFLLQGIFPIQGSDLGLLHLLLWQVGSSLLSHLESPQNHINLAKQQVTSEFNNKREPTQDTVHDILKLLRMDIF